MKKVISLIIVFFLCVPIAFAEWLGWKEHDKTKEGIVVVYKESNLGPVRPGDDALTNMVLYGKAAVADHGTTCEVLEKKKDKAKVRVTAGPNSGFVGWVHIEALRK